MTVLEELGCLWTLGEDMNCLGKIVVYTVGLPVLIIIPVMHCLVSGMDFAFVKKERR